MKRRDLLISSALGSALFALQKSGWAAEGKIPASSAFKNSDGLPREWIDSISHKKIIRLSQLDNTKSLYFHDNAFTGDSRYMVMNTPNGIGLYDFTLHKYSLLVEGRYEAIMVSYTKPICYARKYAGEFKGKDNTNRFDSVEYYAIDIPSGKENFIGIFPEGFITSVNADDTLMAGAYATEFVELQPGPKVANTDGGYNALGADGKPLSFAEAKEVRMAERLAKNIPMEIFTIEIATGKRTVVTKSTDWLNHVQFSPADPHKLMYCHEGPWHMVDRVWTIDTNGKNKQKVHQRTMNMEIAGHEFFSFDGKTIYYDMQTPRGEVFWLASVHLETQKRHWYHLSRNEWSVHYQISRDGKLWAGDGGDHEMVARAQDGKYIYLFEPEIIDDIGASAANAEQLIRPGKLTSTKLVDMRNHDYRVEPNLQFSPDNKYLIFRSNMQGAIHTYAVEL
ncbi:oligogalacturonate lyase family protein [Cellvibrio sp. NN19]|uniref:oligogalacturonate lyase family protein n=1 Tax=Cellvibrio chitinivorans TaxID=3102792 RepID=UPI002B4093EC|nr:oligogalacturonate lyase family protein [Cellvibrio sp. NN19]